MDLLEGGAIKNYHVTVWLGCFMVHVSSGVKVSCLPRTLYAPIPISGALLFVIMVGCSTVRVAEGNDGFMEWGVSGSLIFALVLFSFVDA